MTRRRVRGGYRWAAAAFVAGLVASGGWYLFALTRTTYQVNDFTRLPFTGRAVELDPGTYTVWVEGDGLSATRFPASDYRAELLPHVTNVATGDELDAAALRSQVFNTGPREGRSLWTFDVRSAGSYSVAIETRYRIDIDVPSGSNVAIGAGRGLRTPIRPWTAMFAATGVGGSVVAAIATWVRRRLSLRRFLTEQ